MIKQNKTKAFTLQEILITIAFLGLIAALTIPVLVQNVNNQNYINGMLVSYKTLKEAAGQIMLDNGGTMEYYASDRNTMMEAYCSKLECVKKCEINTPLGICRPAEYKDLAGNTAFLTNFNLPGAILSNGMTLIFRYWSEDCSFSCGDILVDVNGFKGPNIAGKDLFYFHVMSYGVTPSYTDEYFCNTSTSNGLTGRGCSRRIMTEGNKMNY